ITVHASHLAFFLNHPATTAIYTLSLHDALPISRRPLLDGTRSQPAIRRGGRRDHTALRDPDGRADGDRGDHAGPAAPRSASGRPHAPSATALTHQALDRVGSRRRIRDCGPST